VAAPQGIEAPSTPLLAGEWRVVAADSELGFVTHILFGLVPVRGRYGDYAGELHIDEQGTASGSLRIDAATVRTGIRKRDAHLRSADFFAVEQHPHMTVELDALRPGADGAQTFTGTLHVRDQALAIEAPISVEQVASDRLRVGADFELDHRRSGLAAAGSGWKKVPQKLGVHAALTLERAS